MKCEALQDQINNAEDTFKKYEKQLLHEYGELNKRITEHDTCVLKGTHEEVGMVTLKLYFMERAFDFGKAKVDFSNECGVWNARANVN